jgi:hypothetical protein
MHSGIKFYAQLALLFWMDKPWSNSMGIALPFQPRRPSTSARRKPGRQNEAMTKKAQQHIFDGFAL